MLVVIAELRRSCSTQPIPMIWTSSSSISAPILHQSHCYKSSFGSVRKSFILDAGCTMLTADPSTSMSVVSLSSQVLPKRVAHAKRARDNRKDCFSRSAQTGMLEIWWTMGIMPDSIYRKAAGCWFPEFYRGVSKIYLSSHAFPSWSFDHQPPCIPSKVRGLPDRICPFFCIISSGSTSNLVRSSHI